MLCIKEQFDPRHYRRDRISSEYKKKDMIGEKESNHPNNHENDNRETVENNNEHIYDI